MQPVACNPQDTLHNYCKELNVPRELRHALREYMQECMQEYASDL